MACSLPAVGLCCGRSAVSLAQFSCSLTHLVTAPVKTVQASVCAGGGPQALWLPGAGGDGAGEPGRDGDGTQPLGEEAAGGLVRPLPPAPTSSSTSLVSFVSSSFVSIPPPPSPCPFSTHPSPHPISFASYTSFTSSVSFIFLSSSSSFYSPFFHSSTSCISFRVFLFLLGIHSSASLLLFLLPFLLLDLLYSLLLLLYLVPPPFPSFSIFSTSFSSFVLFCLHPPIPYLLFLPFSSSISFSPPLPSPIPPPFLHPPHTNGLTVQQNEAMTGSHTQNRVFSRITLALMEDSGWYSADYRLAEKLDWGRGLGCDFVLKSCKFWMDRQRRRSGCSSELRFDVAVDHVTD